jgi:hypothetical protein
VTPASPAISASTATAAIPPPAKDMSNTVEYMNDEQIHANYIP